VLARLALADGRIDEANSQISGALKIDPANPEAQELGKQILARTGVQQK